MKMKNQAQYENKRRAQDKKWNQVQLRLRAETTVFCFFKLEAQSFTELDNKIICQTQITITNQDNMKNKRNGWNEEMGKISGIWIITSA